MSETDSVAMGAGTSRARIGILRIGSLGDHLIALPLYRRLRARHGQDSLILISNVPLKGDPKRIGPASILPDEVFDQIHSYPVGSDPKSVWAKYLLFRRLRLDRLYYLMPARTESQLWRDRVFFGVTNTPVLGLFSDASRLSKASWSRSEERCEHELERLNRAVFGQVDPLRRVPGDLSLELTEPELAQARSVLEEGADPTVALSIGTKCDVNDWGMDNWTRLIAGLGDVAQVERLVLIGAADEFQVSERLRASWPRAAVNLCGRLTPRVSAAVIAQCKLFVGHDSGPMHMAAAVGTPIVSVFSSRNPPGMWFPLNDNHRIHYTRIECMGCARVRCDDRNKECIRRITPEEVLASCIASLRAGLTSENVRTAGA